ncbi:MFS transporter [Propionibacteriaceae bacterium Y1923]|uniref:MFS transporter n=1 Tax=Aestuariimicrobium sp. Y1814 TaxID=3418742 RepID=UPI003C16C1C6
MISNRTNGTAVPMFASFGIFNYRLFWIGALVSNVGGWMFSTAHQWMVLTELTDHSATALGYVTALTFAPMALLAPVAGALTDRFDRRKMLLTTQSLLAVNAFVVWALYASGVMTLGLAFVFATLSGVIQAFDMPARQTFVSEMVPRHLIPNAIGLNSAQFNAARLVGPGVAGLVIAGFGVGPALLINGISFAAVLAGLLLMRPDELLRSPKVRERNAIIGGIRYVAGRPDIIAVMVVVATLSMFGMQFPLTNALMATTEFGKGAGEFGILGSAMAVGTFAAALLAAKRARPRFRTTLLALAGFAVTMALAASAPTYTTYMLLLVPMGLCAITVLTNCNAMVQMTTDPQFRGRALSVYLAVNMGGSPIGSLVLGRVCDVWGARAGLALGAAMTGLVALGVAVWMMRRDGIELRLDRYWPPQLGVRNRAVEEALGIEGTPAEPGAGAHA